MTKEQQNGKIIKIVKNAIADNTAVWNGEDDIIALDCNDVDHIAEEVAEKGYDLYSSVFGNEIKSLKRGIKELQDENAELNRECDIVDDYTIGFATHLMQKQRDEVDRMQAEIKNLQEENAYLLKVCEEKFTFDTTENKTYSIFNSVRKVFAEELKEKLHNDYIMPSGETDERLVFECVDEVLKEYEK